MDGLLIPGSFGRAVTQDPIRTLASAAVRCHLTFHISMIGTVRVSLDQFPDGDPIFDLIEGDGDMCAHELFLLFCRSHQQLTQELPAVREMLRSHMCRIRGQGLSS